QTSLWKGMKSRLREARHEATPAEKKLWSAVRANKLGVKFRFQHPVAAFYVDFYCVEAGLAIELDGSVHDIQVEEHHEHQLFIEANNIRVIRFTNDEVMKELPKVVQTIRAAVGSDRRSPSPESGEGWRQPG